MSGAVEVWRGGVNAWECDDMGHMNTRFYVTRSTEGIAVLFGFLGMPGLFARNAHTTLAFGEQHIRFLKEAHVGAPLDMSAGIIDMGTDDALALLMLRHSRTGEIAATFRTHVRHVLAADGHTAVPWPSGTADRASGYRVAVPPQAAPRSVGSGPVNFSASLELADMLGLTRIAMGVIGPESCDILGRMLPYKFIGYVSDGARQLTGTLRDIVVQHSPVRPQRYGGAVLEFRILHTGWPVCGDCFEIRSGFQRAEGRTLSMIHWMLDPFTGRHLGSMQSVTVAFDLDARKIVPITPEAQAALAAHAIPNLAL